MNSLKKYFYPHTQEDPSFKGVVKADDINFFSSSRYFSILGVGVYKNSIAWVLVLLWMALIFIFSSIGDYSPIAPVGPKTHDVVSIIAHIFLYAILMALVLLAVISYPKRYEKFWHGRAAYRWQYFFVSLFVAVFYGFTDEWHQLFVAGRESSIFDWLTDVVGAVVVLFLVAWCVRKKRNNFTQ